MRPLLPATSQFEDERPARFAPSIGRLGMKRVPFKQEMGFHRHHHARAL